jgi:hypothetical protein
MECKYPVDGRTYEFTGTGVEPYTVPITIVWKARTGLLPMIVNYLLKFDKKFSSMNYEFLISEKYYKSLTMGE